MPPDQPPRNRQERRHPPKAVLLYRPPLRNSQNQSSRPVPDIAGGSPSVGIDEMSTFDETVAGATTDLPPDVPPKRGRGRPPKGDSPPRSTPTAGKYASMRATLTRYHTLMGIGLATVAPYTGMVMALGAEAAADAWITTAKEYPQVDRALVLICKGGPFLALSAAYTPIVLAAMVETGALPLEARDQLDLPPMSPEQMGRAIERRALRLAHMAERPPRPDRRREHEVSGGSGTATRGSGGQSGAAMSSSTPLGATPPVGVSGITVAPEMEPMIATLVTMRAAQQPGRPLDAIREELLIELASEANSGNGNAPISGASLGSLGGVPRQ